MACAYKSLKIVRQLYEQQNSQWINASSEQKHFIIFPNMFSFEKNNHLETIRTRFSIGVPWQLRLTNEKIVNKQIQWRTHVSNLSYVVKRSIKRSMLSLLIISNRNICRLKASHRDSQPISVVSWWRKLSILIKIRVTKPLKLGQWRWECMAGKSFRSHHFFLSFR